MFIIRTMIFVIRILFFIMRTSMIYHQDVDHFNNCNQNILSVSLSLLSV